jgi:hypothetical protein
MNSDVQYYLEINLQNYLETASFNNQKQQYLDGSNSFDKLVNEQQSTMNSACNNDIGVKHKPAAASAQHSETL